MNNVDSAEVERAVALLGRLCRRHFTLGEYHGLHVDLGRLKRILTNLSPACDPKYIYLDSQNEASARNILSSPVISGAILWAGWQRTPNGSLEYPDREGILSGEPVLPRCEYMRRAADLLFSTAASEANSHTVSSTASPHSLVAETVNALKQPVSLAAGVSSKRLKRTVPSSTKDPSEVSSVSSNMEPNAWLRVNLPSACTAREPSSVKKTCCATGNCCRHPCALPLHAVPHSCSAVPFLQSFADKRYSCGYRNLQTLLGTLVSSAQAGAPRCAAISSGEGMDRGAERHVAAAQHLVRCGVVAAVRRSERGRSAQQTTVADTTRCIEVSTVLSLQHILQAAWDRGFDRQGASHFPRGIIGTSEWIGPTDAAACCSLLGIPTVLIDIANVDLQQISTVGCTLARLWRHLSGQTQPLRAGPCMLQWAGHSVTIIGADFGDSKSSSTFFIADPKPSRQPSCLLSQCTAPAMLKYSQLQFMLPFYGLMSARGREASRVLSSVAVKPHMSSDDLLVAVYSELDRLL